MGFWGEKGGGARGGGGGGGGPAIPPQTGSKHGAPTPAWRRDPAGSGGRPQKRGVEAPHAAAPARDQPKRVRIPGEGGGEQPHPCSGEAFSSRDREPATAPPSPPGSTAGKHSASGRRSVQNGFPAPAGSQRSARAGSAMPGERASRTRREAHVGVGEHAAAGAPRGPPPPRSPCGRCSSVVVKDHEQGGPTMKDGWCT